MLLTIGMIGLGLIAWTGIGLVAAVVIGLVIQRRDRQVSR